MDIDGKAVNGGFCNQNADKGELMAKRTIGFLFSGNLFVLLFSLLGVLLVNPFLPDYIGPVKIMDVLLIIVLMSSIFSLANRLVIYRICLVLLVLELALSLAIYFFGYLGLAMAHHGVLIVFFCLACGAIGQGIIKAPRVTAQLVAGAVCIFILLAFIWGSAYALLDLASPGSFDLGAHQAALDIGKWDHLELMIYLSVATLTTLGFGDILPLTPAAAALVMVEALIGQLYLAVMIARLVGLHTAMMGLKKADQGRSKGD